MTTTGDPRSADIGATARSGDGRFAGEPEPGGGDTGCSDDTGYGDDTGHGDEAAHDHGGEPCDCARFRPMRGDSLMGFRQRDAAGDVVVDAADPTAIHGRVPVDSPGSWPSPGAVASGGSDGPEPPGGDGTEASGSDGPGGIRSVSRRRFIQGLAATGALGYVVVRAPNPVERNAVESQVASQRASTGADAGPAPAGDPLMMAPPDLDSVDTFADYQRSLLTPAPIDQRVLVLIEFAGGNDGPSMVVPYGSSAYYDQRPNLAIAQEEVLPLDPEVGLSPALARLYERQIAAVEGVGPVDGVLSHFEMMNRWDQGDMRGQGGQRAGFLARLSDSVDIGGAVTGLSVAGNTPRLEASRSSTLALSNLNQLRVLTDDEWIYPAYRAAVRRFGGGPMSTTMSQSWGALIQVGESMSSDIDRVDGDSLMVREGGGLGRQLAMAAEMVKSDVGVRVIHAQLGGFDTHEGHSGRHNRLMQEFDAAVEGFFQEIEAAGMLDRVLVATTSEFGRRVRQNGSGLDHGAASSMLLIGPIQSGRLGEPSPLNDLDRNDNLKTTIPFDRYLASLAQEWLGIEAASVLPNAPQPIGIF